MSRETPAKDVAPVSTSMSPVAQESPSVPVPVGYIMPPCFARRPPSGNIYPPFQPMYLASIGHYLNKGFPQMQPTSNVEPHPFVTRVVAREDWSRFLYDLLSVGQLTESEDMWTCPLMCFLAGLIGLAIAQHFRRKFKKEKAVDVCAMIGLWNESFFHPRKMEVFLARGQQRLSGDRQISVPGPLHIQPEGKAPSSLQDGEAHDGDKGKEYGNKVAQSANTLSSLGAITAEDKVYRLFVVVL